MDSINLPSDGSWNPPLGEWQSSFKWEPAVLCRCWAYRDCGWSSDSTATLLHAFIWRLQFLSLKDMLANHETRLIHSTPDKTRSAWSFQRQQVGSFLKQHNTFNSQPCFTFEAPICLYIFTSVVAVCSSVAAACLKARRNTWPWPCPFILEHFYWPKRTNHVSAEEDMWTNDIQPVHQNHPHRLFEALQWRNNHNLVVNKWFKWVK